ncbi:MAG: hypothetical protein KDI32_07895 [Pseudomonadales bacterium]|jgi:hypothetical protein|nr:hypothetical protein [Pseudomonadales bacterium]
MTKTWKVRAIPGGLKNAIDWRVARDAIVHQPIALALAARRGGDVLNSLRRVLSTITRRFAEQVSLRVPLMSLAAAAAPKVLASPAVKHGMSVQLATISRFMGSSTDLPCPADAG